MQTKQCVLCSVLMVGCVGSMEEEDFSAEQALRRDRTPPTVSFSSPVNGSVVSGTVTIQGAASDNRAVGSVEVQIDTNGYAPAVGTTSWSFSWNTAAVGNGTHTVTARAWDTAGRSATN